VSELFALRASLPRRYRAWFAVAAPALVVGLWCLLSYGALVESTFLPSPTDVVKGLLQLFFEKDLGAAIGTSTRRITLAFLMAAACAFPLGVLMGAFEPVNRFFEPIMAPLRFMPISAFIPLLIVWFGIDEAQKIAFLFLGVFVYLLPVVVTAIRNVPQEYVDTAYTLGASRAQVIFTVLIPAAMPEIFESFRVMNAIAWTYVILAEAVNPGTSLGYLIQLAYTHAKPQWSFAGLVVIGGVGLLTDGLLRALNALLFRWKETTHG
jgi:NitT/TauT family transport system permease protein